jgi:hypothetical protein
VQALIVTGQVWPLVGQTARHFLSAEQSESLSQTRLPLLSGSVTQLVWKLEPEFTTAQAIPVSHPLGESHATQGLSPVAHLATQPPLEHAHGGGV